MQGVLLGGLYALYAAGLSLIFGIMRLVNLAHGDLIVLAAFVILALVEAFGLNPFVAAAHRRAADVRARLGAAARMLNRTLGEDILPPLLVTFGLSIVIQNGLLEAFSADSRRLPARRARDRHPGARRRIAVGVMPLLTFVSAVAVIVGAEPALLPHRARPRVPRHLGRPRDGAADGRRHPSASSPSPWASRSSSSRSPPSSWRRAPTSIRPSARRGCIYAFEAVIIGGLGSLWGTLAGGIILGVAQTIGAAINPEWQILAGHLAFLVVLVVRPRGLFPRAVD